MSSLRDVAEGFIIILITWQRSFEGIDNLKTDRGVGGLKKVKGGFGVSPNRIGDISDLGELELSIPSKIGN